jgi:hypothetical protein
LNGSVIARRDVIIAGNGVRITPTGNTPAVIAGRYFTVNTNANTFTINGTVYSVSNATINSGSGGTIIRNANNGLALVTGGSLTIPRNGFSATGALYSSGNMTISGNPVSVNSADNFPALATLLVLTQSGQNFTATGEVYTGGAAAFSANGLKIYGTVICGGALTYGGTTSVNYVDDAVYNPPPHIYEP